jgi:hypothetical protein
MKRSLRESHDSIVKKIDYYSNISPKTKEKNENSYDNDIVSTPFLKRDSIEVKNENDDNNNNNKLSNQKVMENSKNENMGLTERLKKLGQKYNNLIKDPEDEIPITNELNKDKNVTDSELKNFYIKDCYEVFKILNTNIQEANENIISNDYNDESIKNNNINNNNNKNLIIKEETIIHSPNSKNKNSEPINNTINCIDNKSSFIINTDVRRTLNFQDSNLFSNFNNEKNENILLNQVNHNRIFSNDRTRLFSDSLSLNYNEGSENNLNNNNIDNTLDKTEADKYINLINDEYCIFSSINNTGILKNMYNQDNSKSTLKNSLNNLNEILNRDMDSLINNRNIKNANCGVINNNILLENEMIDSREYMINNIIDNHIKHKNSFLKVNSSILKENKENEICNFNEKDFIIESHRSLKNGKNIENGLYYKNEMFKDKRYDYENYKTKEINIYNLNNKNNNLNSNECKVSFGDNYITKNNPEFINNHVIYNKNLTLKNIPNLPLDNIASKNELNCDFYENKNNSDNKLDITECQYPENDYLQSNSKENKLIVKEINNKCMVF